LFLRGITAGSSARRCKVLFGSIVRKHGYLNSRKTALIDERERLTFRQVNQRVNQIVHALQDRGVKKGDRIGVLLYNCNEIIEMYFACAKGGFVAVPVNYRLLPREILYLLKDFEPKVFVFDQEFSHTVKSFKDQAGSIRHWIALGGRVSGSEIETFEDAFMHSQDEEPIVDLSDDDLAMIMYTSGTTGVPKGAMITQRNLMASIINQCMAISPSRDDVLINFPPLFHLGGLSTFLSHFTTGCTHITIRQFDVVKALEWIEKERPTAAHLVPAMQNMVVSHPDVGKYDLSSLRNIHYGASAMLTTQLRRSMEVFHCRYFQISGSTEVTGTLTTLLPQEHVVEGPPEKVERLGSAGKEVLGLEVKIVNEKGEECPPGVAGEAIVRGDAVTGGYWNMDEETRKTIVDGWLHTGDVCVKDEDGYVYYKDRIKDMINRGGEKVFPREVEEVIVAHPAVKEVAVIGVPDERLGEEVKAIIVLNPGQQVSEEEIIALCKENLAAYKRPRSVDFVKELPKNPTGKILKKILRKGQTGDNHR
jgi:acyl-CoA synthetase (AMP-forming)/AMP-acid ligase II